MNTTCRNHGVYEGHPHPDSAFFIIAAWKLTEIFYWSFGMFAASSNAACGSFYCVTSEPKGLELGKP